MRHRISTRKNFTVETAVVGAVFEITDDLLRRTIGGIAFAAVLLWVLAQAAVGLLLLGVCLLWQRVPVSDRATLSTGTRVAVRGTLALVREVPALTASAIAASSLALWSAWRWCDRQACRVIRQGHDVVLEEHRRSQERERQAWLAIRESFRPALDPTPMGEPDYDDYEDLWQDVGDPVGRQVAA